MGQIAFSRGATGPLSAGVFLLGISAFLYSMLDPTFGPLAIGCTLAGGVVAVGVAFRNRRVTHIHMRPFDVDDEPPKPSERK